MLNPRLVTLLSLIIRLLVMYVGHLQDQYSDLPYTDIDYGVFSDGAKLIYHGGSPYDRPTYRYSPLLAYLVLPNMFFGPCFGKILFILFDVATGMMIRTYNKSCTKNQSLLSLFLWDFNPFVINISTRGNSDSIPSFLLVFTLYLLKNRHFMTSALIFGISVHLRIFPAFFVPSLFMALGLKVVPYGVISFSAFMALNILFYQRFGEKFVTETFLYHLYRTDYKHNFAPPWLSVYTGGSPGKIWSLARIFMILLASWKCRSSIELSWAAVIMIFIGYNTVCTVQYFDWAFALFALIPSHLCTKSFVVATVFWVLAHVGWLLMAYQLEFRAMNAYSLLWCCSMVVFFSNNALIGVLLKEADKKQKVE